MTKLTDAFSNLANDPKKATAYIGEKRTQSLAGKPEETTEKTWLRRRDIKMDLN
jgi:hypothetical protein